MNNSFYLSCSDYWKKSVVACLLNMNGVSMDPSSPLTHYFPIYYFKRYTVSPFDKMDVSCKQKKILRCTVDMIHTVGDKLNRNVQYVAGSPSYKEEKWREKIEVYKSAL